MTAVTFTGNGDGTSWSDADNWDNGVPSPSDEIVVGFGHSVTATSVTIANTLSGAGTIIGAFTLDGGTISDLTLSGVTIMVGNGYSGTLDGVSLDDVSLNDVDGTLDIDAAGNNDTLAGGSITDDGDVTVTGVVFLTGTLDGEGSLSGEIWLDGGTIEEVVLNGATINVGYLASGALDCNGTVGGGGIYGSLTLSDSVTVTGTLTGGGTVLGVVTLDGGTIDGLGLDQTEINVASGNVGTLDASGVLAGGDIDGELDIPGSVTLTGTLGGSGTITGQLALDGGTIADLHLDGVTILGTNPGDTGSLVDVTFTDLVIVSNGYLEIDGSGNIDDAAIVYELTLSGSVTLTGAIDQGTVKGELGLDGGSLEYVVLDGLTVTVASGKSGTILGCVLDGVTVDNDGLIDIAGATCWSATLQGNGTTVISDNVDVLIELEIDVPNGLTIGLDATVTNVGTIDWLAGDIALIGDFYNYGDIYISDDVTLSGAGLFYNNGATIEKVGGTGSTDFSADDMTFIDTVVERSSGSFEISAGNVTVAGAEFIEIEVGVVLIGNDTVTFVDCLVDGATIVGVATIKGTTTFSEVAVEYPGTGVEVESGATLIINTSLAVTGSWPYVANISNSGTIEWNGDATGATAKVTNSAGGVVTLAPGVDLTGSFDFFNSGTLIIADDGVSGTNSLGGDFYQTSSGLLIVELKKVAGNLFDQFQVGSGVDYNGTLFVRALPDVEIHVGDEFPIVTHSDWYDGMFSAVKFDYLGNNLWPSLRYSDTETTVVFLQATADPLDGNLHRVEPPECGCIPDPAPIPVPGASSGLPSDVAGALPSVEFDSSPVPAKYLIYDSNTAAPRPAFVVQVPTDGAQQAPPNSITLTLTFDGAGQSGKTFDTSGGNAGDTWELGVQLADPLTASGVYNWTIEVSVNYTGSTLVQQVFGVLPVEVRNAPYGHGWKLDLEALLVGAEGVAVVADGDLSYHQESEEGFATPPDSYDTLTQNLDDTYDLAEKDGVVKKFNAGGQLTSVVSPGGTAVTYTYAGGNVSSIVDSAGRRTTFSYASGYLSSIQHPNGSVTTFTHSTGDLVGIANPDGGGVTFTYNAGHKITQRDDGTKVSDYTYDQYGFLDEVYDPWTWTPRAEMTLDENNPVVSGQDVRLLENPLGDTTTYTLDAYGRVVTADRPGIANESVTSYNDAGQITSFVDALGNRTTYTYSPIGNLTRYQGPDGGVYTLAYDATFNKVNRLEDPYGKLTTYSYDALTGDLLTIKDSLGKVYTYTYSTGRLQTAVDPLGNKTTYVWDSGDLRGFVSPTGERSTFTYNGAGDLTGTESPSGSLATTIYDTMGRAIGQIDAAGVRTTSVYDGAGNLIASVDPLGNRTSYVYDVNGWQIETIDPLGNRTTTVYDLAGQVIATVDPFGNRTSYSYDDAERQVAVEDYLGNRTTTVYDDADRVIASIDQYGQRTTFVFDEVGRQIAMVDPFNNRSTTVYDNAGRVEASIDPYGNRTTFVYDDAGRQTVTIDPYSQRSTTVYDDAGRVQATLDQFTNRTTYVYDNAGRQIATIDYLGNRTTTVFDAYGRTEATVNVFGDRTTFVYDAAGRVEATIDYLGHRTTTVYDAYGRVQVSIDVLGNRTTAVYDAYGRVEATIDILGNRTTTVFDSYSRVESTLDALGNRTTTLYDTHGRYEASIDPLGNRSTVVYDAFGRTSATIDVLGNRTTTVYDAFGRSEASIDALGNHTTTVFDAQGRYSATIDALNYRTTVVYDGQGRHEASIDALGNRTTTVYDAIGRAVATINALNQRTTMVFDSKGRYEATIDALGNRTSVVYDSFGRTQASIDALGHRVTTAYDSHGRAEATIDALTYRTTTVYDAFGRPEASIDALGNRTSVVYDSYGRQEATIDPLGHRTSTVFDAYGRAHVTVDALGGRTTIVFDSLSRRVNLIDSVGNKTTFVYDALSREIEQIDPHGGSATFAYDALSRLASTTDRLDRRRDFLYDEIGQLETETWVSALGATQNVITHTYDAVGNKLTGADYDGTYTMVYDALGRVTQVTDLWGLLQTFTYDAVGNRTKVQDSFGGITTSVYDAAHNLTIREYGGTGPYLGLFFGYTERNELKSVVRTDTQTFPSETELIVRTSYTYDALGRMTNLHHRDDGGASISNFTYTYDAASRVTTEVTNGTTKTYTYDNTDQLTADGTVTVTYDANGNRNNGSYTTGTGNQITGDGTWTYSYDAEGNMTKKSQGVSAETWTYGYDQRNQLLWTEKRATDGGTLQMRADYTYDWNGNRIQKAVDTDGDTDIDTTERYAYDGWKTGPQTQFVGNENWDIVADLNGSSSLTTRYLRGDVVDQIFARTDAGSNEAYWLLTDRLGSLRTVLDDTQTVKDNIAYDGFGNVISESDAAYGGRYKWTGREVDVETGLQYNRARYYDGKIGRWISRDPLGFEAGDSNLYRYVTNTPTLVSDPSGLQDAGANEFLGGVLSGKLKTTQEIEAALKKAMQGEGKWSAWSFFHIGMGGQMFEWRPATTDYWGLFSITLHYKARTDDGYNLSRGCLGLVYLRINGHVYGKQRYYTTDLNEAVAKAKSWGDDARLIAIQNNNKLVYVNKAVSSEVTLESAQDNSGNHATWHQPSDGHGYWEYLGPHEFDDVDLKYVEDFAKGTAKVVHSKTLPKGFINTIYGVVVVKEHKWRPLLVGPIAISP